MGEFTASDCSWKKMVIAKTNDQWISTIKTEQTDSADGAESTTGFSLEDEQGSFGNVKREQVEISVDPSYPNIQYVGDDILDGSPQDDPLSIAQPSKRRRRKFSGPKNESSEDRAARLAKMSAYAAQRLASETAEQRAARLRRMSEYAAKRLAQETSEQRAKRLARMSAYAARRLAKETPEQRQARLTRMSAYAARRHALKKIGSPGTSENMFSQFEQQITNNIMPDQS